MNSRHTRLFVRLVLLALLGCLTLIAAVARSTTQSTPSRPEHIRSGFTQRAGQAWFYCEQLADDVRSRIASCFSSVRNNIVPSAVKPPPPIPTGIDSVQLPEKPLQPPTSD